MFGGERPEDAAHSFAYGGESEIFGPYFLGRQPEQFGGIVGGLRLLAGFQAAAEEGVGRVYLEAGIRVGVGQGEQVFLYLRFRARFLAHFAQQAFVKALARVNEASGQIQCTAGRFQRPTGHQQFAAWVEDDRHGRGRGIVVVYKAAGRTPAAPRVVVGKAGGAAARAEPERGKGMGIHGRYR